MPKRIPDLLRKYQGSGRWDIYISAPEINQLIVLAEALEAENERLRDSLTDLVGGFSCIDEGRDKWAYNGLVDGDEIRSIHELTGLNWND